MTESIYTRGPEGKLRFKTENEYVPVDADTVIRTIKLNRPKWWEWSKETTVQWQFFYDISRDRTMYPRANRFEYLYKYFKEKGCLAENKLPEDYIAKFKDGERLNSRNRA